MAISLLMIGAGVLAPLSLARGEDNVVTWSWEGVNLQYTLSAEGDPPTLVIFDNNSNRSMAIKFEEVYAIIRNDRKVGEIFETGEGRVLPRKAYLNCTVSKMVRGPLIKRLLGMPLIKRLLGMPLIKRLLGMPLIGDPLRFFLGHLYVKQELLKIVLEIEEGTGKANLKMIPADEDYKVGATINMTSYDGIVIERGRVRVKGGGSRPYLDLGMKPDSHDGDWAKIEISGILVGNLGVSTFKEPRPPIPVKEILITVIATAAIIVAILAMMILVRRGREEEEIE